MTETCHTGLQQSHAEAFKQLGPGPQRVKKLASKLHVHSVNRAAKLVHTRRALYSTFYRLSSGDGFRSSLQPSWSPSIFSFFFFWWRSFTVPDTKVAPFPLLMWGVVFHCLRSFFFLLFLLACIAHTGVHFQLWVWRWPREHGCTAEGQRGQKGVYDEHCWCSQGGWEGWA